MNLEDVSATLQIRQSKLHLKFGRIRYMKDEIMGFSSTLRG